MVPLIKLKIILNEKVFITDYINNPDIEKIFKNIANIVCLNGLMKIIFQMKLN